jgi:hypothetical protein
MSHNGYATNEDGLVTSPGKYEGEPFWVPELHEQDAQEEIATDGDGWYGLYLDNPTPDYAAVILYERNDGFVFSSVFDTQAAALAEWDEIAAECCETYTSRA